MCQKYGRSTLRYEVCFARSKPILLDFSSHLCWELALLLLRRCWMWEHEGPFWLVHPNETLTSRPKWSFPQAADANLSDIDHFSCVKLKWSFYLFDPLWGLKWQSTLCPIFPLFACSFGEDLRDSFAYLFLTFSLAFLPQKKVLLLWGFFLLAFLLNLIKVVYYLQWRKQSLYIFVRLLLYHVV